MKTLDLTLALCKEIETDLVPFYPARVDYTHMAPRPVNSSYRETGWEVAEGMRLVIDGCSFQTTGHWYYPEESIIVFRVDIDYATNPHPSNEEDRLYAFDYAFQFSASWRRLPLEHPRVQSRAESLRLVEGFAWND